MSGSRIELAVIAALLATAVLFGFAVIPAAIDLGFNAGGTGLSPRFMPQLATAGLALALAFGVVKLAFAIKLSDAEASSDSTDTIHPLRALGAVLICLLFAFVGFELGGFYIGGVVMGIVLTTLLGERNLFKIIVVPLFVLSVIYVVFELGLQISLPKANLIPGVAI